MATLDYTYSSKGGALVEKLRNLFFCRFAYLRFEHEAGGAEWEAVPRRDLARGG